MATAEQESAATEAAPDKSKPESKGLWLGMKIPIIGVTGEYGSGKTLFGLTIDSNCFSRDRSTPPTTLHWDTEDSSESFETALHFKRRDLSAMLLEKYPKGHKPIQLYEMWLADMRAIPPGKYRVGMLDTISEIEEGLCDWVRQHPGEFGHSRNQYASMEGLYWGDVKSHWKRILSEAQARFETFVFASHTKQVWAGKKPVPGQRTAKGKETLWELASLYLWLNRDPKPGSKTAPVKPSAVVFQNKNRLVWFNYAKGELQPILPPRLPEATPQGIRAYIEHPANYAKLKVGERAEESGMSEDERLTLQAGIAENEATAAQANLSREELLRQGAAAQGAAMGQPSAVQREQQQPAGQQPQQPRQQAPQQQAPPTAFSNGSGNGNGQPTATATATPAISPGQQRVIDKIQGLLKQICETPAEAQQLLTDAGASPITSLTPQKAAAFIGALEDRLARKQAGTTKRDGRRKYKGKDSDPADFEQRRQVAQLMNAVRMPAPIREQTLASRGAKEISDLTSKQAEELIGKLQAKQTEDHLVGSLGEGDGKQGSNGNGNGNSNGQQPAGEPAKN